MMTTKPLRQRIDSLLVARGFFETREQARRAVMAGDVRVGEQVVDKAGTKIPGDAVLQVKVAQRYVSRGGFKIEAALDHFQLDPTAATCLDIGASTGGFTDCLLQRGAAKVYAIDVGHSQLHWKIRRDPRVLVQEKVNARLLDRSDVPEEIDLCVVDVSFISLTLILPCAFPLLAPGGTVVALIKPQFELVREEVGSGGIVRDAESHQRAVTKIERFVLDQLGQRWCGFIESPILGREGNKEFLACLRKS